MMMGLISRYLQLVGIVNSLRDRPRPNLILLVTDDLDTDSAYVLWETQKKIKEEGVDLTNAYATTSICCPSRSSILTGLYAHNHGVMTNTGPICCGQDWQENHEKRTFAYYLNRHAKYRTAMFGKYLNEYNGSYVPPGWDTWHSLIKNSQYYNYRLKVKGWAPDAPDGKDEIEKHGYDYSTDYLTDLVANRSCEWLEYEKQKNPDSPLLLTVNFPAPHGPEDAAPAWQTVFNSTRQPINLENYNYVNNEKKHSLLRQIDKQMDPETIKFGNMLRRKRLQTLLSVDDAVNKIVSKVEKLGMIDETYFIFTSDHGYHIGQFGMVKGKSTPYEFDIKIPFYVRGPDIRRRTNRERQKPNPIVLNIDIAPTLLGFAGITPPAHMDGLNMAGVLRGFFTETRDTFLIEKKPRPVADKSLKDENQKRASELIDTECQQNPRKYKPRRSRNKTNSECSNDQTDVCIWNAESNIWKMVTCKVKGFMDPVSGQCNCDTGFVNTISKEKKPRKHRRGTLRRDRRRKSLDRSRRQLDGRRKKTRTRSMMVSKQESSLNMLTSSCGINREGKIDCQLKSKEDWRNNLNQAQRKFDDLQRDMEQHRRLLDKLKKSKPASRHRDTSRTHIPCTCLHPESFKTRTDRTYKEIKEKRKREQEEKEKIKQRKLQRKTLFQRSCKRDGMSCFTVDNSTWLVPPRWEGDPQCHCTSSSNSSYSCIRKIGHGNDADENYAYCEFFEGSTIDGDEEHEAYYFKEYYDLDNDPYQLDNIYDQLGNDFKNQLRTELTRLRHCRGRDCSCSLDRGGIDGCGDTGAPAGLKPTAKGNRNQISG